MKLILFFCLFAVSTSAPFETDTPEFDERSTNETSAVSRVETALLTSDSAGARQFGSRGATTAVKCSGNCESTWRREQGLSGSSSTQNWNLNTFCEAHDKFTNCLNSCASSEEKTKLLKRISKDQWICHESTYKRNAPCLNEAFKSTAATCDRVDKCGKYDNDDGSLKDMVKQLCLSMKCKLDCRGPTIVNKCGQQAKNDEAGVAKKTAEYLKWRLQSAGRLSDFPTRECDQLSRA